MSSVKEIIVEIEHSTLSKYACFSDMMTDRELPIHNCDMRGEFQRDRDRILHSKAFRRLMHKTQVFLSPEAPLSHSPDPYFGGNADSTYYCPRSEAQRGPLRGDISRA